MLHPTGSVFYKQQYTVVFNSLHRFVITSVLFSVTTFFPLLLSHALRARTNATSNKQGKRKTLHVFLISIHNIKFIANMGFLFTTQVSLLFFKFYFRSITLYSNVNTDNEKGRAVCLLTSVVSSFSMPLPILTLFHKEYHSNIELLSHYHRMRKFH